MIQMGNMYGDSIHQRNFYKGCKYKCRYCEDSFKRQAKRQKEVINKNGVKQGCNKCYKYIPHAHLDRLQKPFPQTTGDQFIWMASSGDITFANKDWIQQAINVIRKHPDKTFFFQSKNPSCFNRWEFPENVILGITLETNRDQYYKLVSNAPLPKQRFLDFLTVKHPRKSITIEPILKFDLPALFHMVKSINPERIYIGYDTKNSGLPEPKLADVEHFIRYLEGSHFNVKKKLMREGYPD